MASTLIFVYGTLKEGFPNARFNTGRRVPGRYRTTRRMAMFVVGRDHVPWLVDDVEGHEHVCGELYEVDATALERLDRLEGVGQARGYHRVTLEVERIGQDAAPGERLQAEAYLQHWTHLEGRPVHAGPLREYTRDHAQHYIDIDEF